MKGSIKVTLWPEDVCNAFTAEEFVRMYGKEAILKGIQMSDVLKWLGPDEILEHIALVYGEDKIKDFLSTVEKQEIA